MCVGVWVGGTHWVGVTDGVPVGDPASRVGEAEGVGEDVVVSVGVGLASSGSALRDSIMKPRQ
ncbi:MAG TPA: hypothetical protein ENN19_09475 [Chloroflexi bacterium]|nr:hypothetical protein [Chloroflexota bacterium]